MATKLKEDDPDIYYDLGVAHTKLAQYDAAAVAFSKSLEIDPDYYRAQDGLDEAKEGIKRIRTGRKHQEDLLKKKKEEELKKAAAGSPARRLRGISMATYTPPPYFPQGSLAPPDKNRYRKFKLVMALVGLLLVLTDRRRRLRDLVFD